MALKKSSIVVNDVLEELNEENKRLLNELLFANKCLNSLIEFKTFIDLTSDKYKQNLDSNQLQKYEELIETIEEVLNEKIIFSQRTNDVKDVNQLNGEELDDGSDRLSIESENDIKCNDSSSEIPPNTSGSGFSCDYRTPCPEDFDLLFAHNRPKPVLCTTCGKSYPTRRLLQRHIIYKHKVLDQPLVCDIDGCNKQFDTEKAFKKHQITIHSNAFECSVDGCGKKFGFECQLRLHMNCHTNDRKHRCPHEGCDKAFKSEQEMKRHYLVVHSDKQLVCDWPGCDYRTSHKAYLKDHKSTHSTDRPFACDWEGCDKTYKTRGDLSKHRLRHTDDKRHACSWPGCTYNAYTARDLKVHLLKHGSERQFTCDWPQCGKQFKTKPSLTQHLKTHYKKSNDGNKQVRYRPLMTDSEQEVDFTQFLSGADYLCNYPECNFKTRSKDNFIGHLNHHKGLDSFECKTCGKGFRTRKLLNRHFTYKHKTTDRILICDFEECNKQFPTEMSLKKHKLGHSGIFECTVDGCGKRFGFESKLKIHMDVHKSERNFTCPREECRKAFKTEYECKRHTFYVHSEKELSCEWPGCEYRTNLRSSLIDHSLTHSSERNVVCDWNGCEQRFKNKNSLAKHRLRHTNDRRHACPWPGCLYRSFTSSHLNTHLKTHNRINV